MIRPSPSSARIRPLSSLRARHSLLVSLRARHRHSLLVCAVAVISLIRVTSGQESVPQHDTCVTSTQCLNGGVCVLPDGIVGFKHCHCPDNFDGSRCEKVCPLKCQNGGICERRNGNEYDADPKNYVCKCRGYFTGTLCNIPYVNCGQQQCWHEGTCTSNQTQPCLCPDGYSGDYCQVRLAKPAKLPFRPGGRVVFSMALGMLGSAIIYLAVVWRRRRYYKALAAREWHDDDDDNEEKRSIQLNIETANDEQWRNVI